MNKTPLNSESLVNTSDIKRLLSIFWAVEAVLAIIGTLQIIIGMLQSNYNWQIAIPVFFSMILFIPVYFLAQKGKTQLGSNVLLLLLTVMLLCFVWKFNGLRDEVLFVFPAIIMISLLIGSQRFAIYIYILVSVNILALGYLNETGFIHNDSADSDIYSAILLTIILTFIGYVAWLIATEMNRKNQALREAKNELDKRVEQRTLELEASIEDLTNTQEQLIQTEKMASLGRLVAGVAHEINTPIGIAVTASSYLEYATDEFSKLFDKSSISKQMLANHIDTTSTSAKLIQSNLNRAADLIQGFKEVAVDQSSDEIREFELKLYLNEILASLHPKIKRSKCQVVLQCHDNIEMKTSPGAIAQIITNLVINSLIHAFSEGEVGTISIDIELQGDHIKMLYKDTGCGISPENLNNIFEPFFTTKRGKGGSGLGMHIVYNLVTQSLGGSIKCTSTLGEGTCFIMRFPCQIPTPDLES